MLVRHDTDLWSVEHEFGWQGGLVRIPVRMTVIRLRDGRLVLHSPIPMAPDLRREIDALGEVGFVVVPWAHGRFAEEAKAAHPSARLLAAPRPPSRRRRLAFDGAIEDHPPEDWGGEIECRRVRGFRLEEVLLFHPASRTLLLTDLCFHIQRSDSRVARGFFKANDMWQRFGPSRIIRNVTVSDRAAFRASLDGLDEWDFERILPGHGDVVEHGSAEMIRAAWPATRR
jgi:hypothetical protein